ncbi:MAG: hypothetical protein C0424_02655 [Sphingobacteriaceae bacterium]|nr:hypothetical protein [Sphingobacteriaceae bacterium]
MKAALQIDLTFNQIMDLVRQLPRTEKIKLSKELEKEFVATKLSSLLKEFRTDELDEASIDAEVEAVRSELYEKSRGKNNH